MNRFKEYLSLIDDSLRTKRKRHILGGIFMSSSLLFWGLMITVLTLKMEEEDEDEKHN